MNAAAGEELAAAVAAARVEEQLTAEQLLANLKDKMEKEKEDAIAKLKVSRCNNKRHSL